MKEISVGPLTSDHFIILDRALFEERKIKVGLLIVTHPTLPFVLTASGNCRASLYIVRAFHYYVNFLGVSELKESFYCIFPCPKIILRKKWIIPFFLQVTVGKANLFFLASHRDCTIVSFQLSFT